MELPQALIPVFTTIGFSTFGAAVAANATVFAATQLASIALQSVLSPKRKGEAQRLEIKETVNAQSQPEFRIYGTDQTGGQLFFYAAKGQDLYIGIIVGSGTVSRFKTMFIFDQDVLIDSATGDVTSPAFISDGFSKAKFEFFHGFVNDPFSNILASGFSEWTGFHILPGLPYFVGKFTLPDDPEKAQQMWRGRQPSLRAVVDGALLYDLNDSTQNLTQPSTHKFSNNPALGAFDYIINTRGRGLSPDSCDFDDFKAASTYCNTPAVTLKGSQRAFTFGGEYVTSEEPKTVLGAIMGTFGGKLNLKPNGRFGVQFGPATETPFEIDDAWIIEDEIQVNRPVYNQYTTVNAFYTSPEHNYTKQPAGTIRNQELIDARGREVPVEFYNDMVQEADQALRLANQRLLEDNPPSYGTFSMDHRGIGILFNDAGTARRRLAVKPNPILGTEEIIEIESVVVHKGFLQIDVKYRLYQPEAYTFIPKDNGFVQPTVPPVLTEGEGVPNNATNFAHAVYIVENAAAMGVPAWATLTGYSIGNQVTAKDPQFPYRRHVWTANNARPNTIVNFDLAESANWTKGVEQADEIRVAISWLRDIFNVESQAIEWRLLGASDWIPIVPSNFDASVQIFTKPDGITIGDTIELRVNRTSIQGVTSGWVQYGALIEDTGAITHEAITGYSPVGGRGFYSYTVIQPNNSAIIGFEQALDTGPFVPANLIPVGSNSLLTVPPIAIASGTYNVKVRPKYLDDIYGPETTVAISVLEPNSFVGSSGDGGYQSGTTATSVNSSVVGVIGPLGDDQFSVTSDGFDDSGLSSSSDADQAAADGVGGLF